MTELDATPDGLRSDVHWATLPDGRLPQRAGDRPEVSWTIPQQQESQNAPAHLQERLFEELRTLAGVEVGPSRISVPDPRAWLVPQVGEFAHLHPEQDGSMHLVLPPDLAADLVTQGWGRPHMWAGSRLSPGFVMVFGPRDETELAVVLGMVAASYAYATGDPAA